MKNKIKLIIGAVFLVSSLTGCASWERVAKSHQSEVNGGLNRVVSVYSQNGQLLRTYKGKIDVQYNDYGNKVLFDLNGKRIIVNGAVVITEEK